MKSAFSFVAGLAAGVGLLSAVGLFAQDNPLSLMQPLVIDIRQAVPVVADVAFTDGDSVITETLPLTVNVALQVSIAGPLAITVTSETTPTVTTVAQTGNRQEQTDDLGLDYTFEIDSPDLTISEWTAYETPNGWLQFAGEATLADDAEPIETIDCVARLYKAGKLVKVVEILNVGYNLEPGGSTRFIGDPIVTPDDVDSYEVTFEVIR